MPVGGVHSGRPRPGARAAHRDRGPRHARAEAASDGAALLARPPRARAGDRSAGGVRVAAVRAHGLRRVVRVGLRPGRAGAHRRAPSRDPAGAVPLRIPAPGMGGRDGAPPPAGVARHDERVRQHRAGARAAPARGLGAKVADLFDAAPDRIFFGTDYPAAMGSLEQLHGQVAQSQSQAQLEGWPAMRSGSCGILRPRRSALT